MGSLLMGVWNPPSSPAVNGAVPVIWARPTDGPARTAAAASKAPPMYRWHISRIPLHCVDDRPRQVPQPGRRPGTRLRAPLPVESLRALGRKVAGTITAVPARSRRFGAKLRFDAGFFSRRTHRGAKMDKRRAGVKLHRPTCR